MFSFVKFIRSPISEFAIGVFLGGVWMLFAYSNIGAYVRTGELSFLAFCVSETLAALFFLVRRIPQSVSNDPFAWSVALAGTLLPLFFRPSDVGLWSYGEVLVLFGVMLQMGALASLNRSFGIVPAHRETKTNGLYRFVRHPMYASYFFLYIGYVFVNTTPANILVAMVLFLLLVVRIHEEEKFLRTNEAYARYVEKVRWRLVPFVY